MSDGFSGHCGVRMELAASSKTVGRTVGEAIRSVTAERIAAACKDWGYEYVD